MSALTPTPTTVMDPAGESLAGVYAQAALSLATDDAQAQALLEELGGVVDLLGSISGLETLLVAAGAGSRQRQELVDRIFAGRVSPVTFSLLGVLAAHDRMHLLRAVHRQLLQELRKRRGEVVVHVTTAAPLGASQKATLVESLRQALGAQPLLETAVDPSLLAGVVLRVGDRLVDASLAARLRRLRQGLSQKVASQSRQMLERELGT